MKLLKQLVLLIILCLFGVYGFVQSGIYNVAATVKDGPLITWLLHTTMEKSAERRAKDIEAPDIKNNEMILAGLSDYVGMCAQCHGEPDQQPSIIRQGLNPAPPDLEHLVNAGTAAEMFWIISNGIRMTGMPAFGKTHNEDEIWPVVAFLQSAKNITPAEFNRMKNKAKSYGHHKSENTMIKNNEDQHSQDSDILSETSNRGIPDVHAENNDNEEHTH